MICCAEQNIQLRPAEGTSGISLICATASAGYFIGDRMKRIPLTKGQFAIVDDEDFDWLSQHKWYATWNKYTKSFYAIRQSKSVNNKKYSIYMAREILGLNRGDKRQSDHIDHVTLNNRKSNLRAVTCQQNQWNQKNPKGYYWHKANKKYMAQIKLHGKQIYLGLFRTADAAHNAYLRAKKHYHKMEQENG